MAPSFVSAAKRVVLHERLVWLAALAVCAGFLYKCDAWANQRQGALKQQLQDLEGRNRRLVATSNSLMTRFQAETVTFTRTVTRRQTVFDSVLVHDTVPITHRESVFIAVADTAIRACTDALGTCVQGLRIRDQMLANKDSQLRVVLAQRPDFFSKVRNGVVVFAAGYLTAKVVK